MPSPNKASLDALPFGALHPVTSTFGGPGYHPREVIPDDPLRAGMSQRTVERAPLAGLIGLLPVRSSPADIVEPSALLRPGNCPIIQKREFGHAFGFRRVSSMFLTVTK